MRRSSRPVAAVSIEEDDEEEEDESLASAALALVRNALESSSSSASEEQTDDVPVTWWLETSEVGAKAVKRARDREVLACRRKARAVRRLRRLRRHEAQQRVENAKREADTAQAALAASSLELDSRLRRFMDASERRLDELRRECLGEREKAKRSAQVRSKSWTRSVDAAHRDASANRRWALFLTALEGSFVDLHFESALLATATAKADEERRLYDDDLVLDRAIAVRSLSGDKRRRQRGLTVPALVDALSQPCAATAEMEEPPELTLTVEPLTWLAAAAPTSCFLDPPTTEDLAFATTRIYERLDDVPSEHHRREDSDEEEPLVSYDGDDLKLLSRTRGPAWVGCERRLYRPATTATLRKSRVLAANKEGVPFLYAVVAPASLRNDAAPDSRLVALSDLAIRMLGAAFLATPAVPLRSLAGLALEGDPRFSLYGPKALPNGDGLLLAWKKRPEEKIESDDDEPISLCDWRACSLPATVTMEKKTVGLCCWHAELKTFLDSTTAGKKESLRYLRAKKTGGKKVMKKDSSEEPSPLLVELANGKLAKTVRLFCKRAAQESATPESDDVPRWLRWRDAKDLSEARTALDRSLQVAETVAALEHNSALELAKLRDAGIFPDRALELIKKEHARLDKERQPPSRARDERLELEFARTKLNLLRAAHNDVGPVQVQRPASAASSSSGSLAAKKLRGGYPPKPTPNPKRPPHAVAASSSHPNNHHRPRASPYAPTTTTTKRPSLYR